MILHILERRRLEEELVSSAQNIDFTPTVSQSFFKLHPVISEYAFEIKLETLASITAIYPTLCPSQHRPSADLWSWLEFIFNTTLPWDWLDESLRRRSWYILFCGTYPHAGKPGLQRPNLSKCLEICIIDLMTKNCVGLAVLTPLLMICLYFRFEDSNERPQRTTLQWKTWDFQISLDARSLSIVWFEKAREFGGRWYLDSSRMYSREIGMDAGDLELRLWSSGHGPLWGS